MEPDRIVYLDTETTDLDPEKGNRIIELAMMEVVGGEVGRTFVSRFNPEGQPINPEASRVHGMFIEDLVLEPIFADRLEDIKNFLAGAEVVAHFMPFDEGFMNAEFARLDRGDVTLSNLASKLTCTRKLAKDLGYPKCSLDALCDQFEVDRSARQLHGAVIDIQLLHQVHVHLVQAVSLAE